MAKKRPDERGAVLVEFALVVLFVGIPMLIGGLFVFSAVIAKTQASGNTPSAANFLAAGGCPTTTTVAGPTTSVPCADGSDPSASCTNPPLSQPPLAEADGGSLYSAAQWNAKFPPGTPGEAADVATLATVCEVDQIVGGGLFDTDPNSLQTAIFCSSPSDPNEVGISGEPCAAPGAVWACVRAWDGNAFTNIIGSLWIGSNSEQIVSPLPPTTAAGTTTTTAAGPTTTTAAGATTTTTAAPGPQYPALDFQTFYQANTYNGSAPLTCGPPAPGP